MTIIKQTPIYLIYKYPVFILLFADFNFFSPNSCLESSKTKKDFWIFEDGGVLKIIKL